MSAGAAVLHAKARVVVLEDTEAFASEIMKRLQSVGNIDCVATSSLEKFVETVDDIETDAASIDWRLNGFDQGGQALDYLGLKQPESGRLVYTFFDMEADAREHDTDYFVRKQLAGLEGYVEAALRAVRLGLGRRTSAHLVKTGHSEWNKPITAATFDPGIEDALYLNARDSLLHGLLNGSCDRDLRDVLMRAGRWRAFNRSAYIKLPWRKKLAEICAFAAVDPDALAKILAIGSKPAELLLCDDAGPTLDPATIEATDHLLSLFSYVLQMAEYEPEAVMYYWTIDGLYGECRPESRPPWDGEGLSKYLQNLGLDGLKQATKWIWSH